ncbi:hypothetical protein [Phenylobacterium sp. 58.2.17]|uniref:hypothetical protein n=1 Tax=Phenylobacterium sp. 58.2.17 TaxID=2969306 RepID=UPI00226465FF|nr:hypothetical protein [Phenylobacterium sp. 58.2.17]MCX7586559.1 hypothetical protein [Phenylobacterium sp. 58.2.17]
MKDLAEDFVDAAETVAARLDEGQWKTLGRFWRGGWRSTAAWVCVAVLAINGAILPLARLFNFEGEPMDWPGLGAFLGGLVVLAHYRSKDLNAQVTT